jgi:hypothetical protein
MAYLTHPNGRNDSSAGTSNGFRSASAPAKHVNAPSAVAALRETLHFLRYARAPGKAEHDKQAARPQPGSLPPQRRPIRFITMLWLCIQCNAAQALFPRLAMRRRAAAVVVQANMVSRRDRSKQRTKLSIGKLPNVSATIQRAKVNHRNFW